MACDTVGSYGSLARYSNINRIVKVGKTMVAADGDISDFQMVKKTLDEFEIEQQCIGDGFFYSTSEIFHRLTTLMYEKRTEMNPYWNNLVICGANGGKPFIGVTDKLGTPYECDFAATGFGLHIAQPLLAENWKPDMSYDSAKALISDALRLCFYRDARAGDRVRFGRVEGANEVVIDENPVQLKTNWGYKFFENSTWDLPH